VVGGGKRKGKVGKGGSLKLHAQVRRLITREGLGGKESNAYEDNQKWFSPNIGGMKKQIWLSTASRIKGAEIEGVRNRKIVSGTGKEG